MKVYDSEGSVKIYRRGTDAIGKISEAAKEAARLPFGHPEAFFEAFAAVYKNATNTMRARIEGRKPTEIELDFPDVEDGVRGMQFLEAVVKSKGQWVKFPK